MYRGIWAHLAAPPPIHPPLTQLTATVKTVTASPFSVLYKHVIRKLSIRRSSQLVRIG